MIPAEIRQKLRPYTSNPPVDIRGCARELGLEIYAAPLGIGVSGVLVRDSKYNTRSGFAIFVDSNEAIVRQRFTAAHEIGHYVLHREFIGDRIEDNYLLRSQGLSNKQEREANRFAADLLMPMDVVEKEVSGQAINLDALAERFKVSRVAMAIQLGLPT